MDNILTSLGLPEKADSVNNLTARDVSERITCLSKDQQFLKYTRQLEITQANPRRHPRYWLFNLGEYITEIGKYIPKTV